MALARHTSWVKLRKINLRNKYEQLFCDFFSFSAYFLFAQVLLTACTEVWLPSAVHLLVPGLRASCLVNKANLFWGVKNLRQIKALTESSSICAILVTAVQGQMVAVREDFTTRPGMAVQRLKKNATGPFLPYKSRENIKLNTNVSVYTSVKGHGIDINWSMSKHILLLALVQVPLTGTFE